MEIKNIIDFYRQFSLNSFFHWQYEYFIIIILVITIFVFHKIVFLVIIGSINKLLSYRSSYYPRVLNNGKQKKILLLGDSTAFGTGADRVEDTLAGRFAHDYPEVEVINYSVNGSLTRDVLSQIKKFADKRFNLVLISTGGNDVWHFTNLGNLEKDLHKVILNAKKISGGNVILLVYSNIAAAPGFPSFLRKTLIRRANKMNDIFLRAADAFNIKAVNLFTDDDNNNPFARNPDDFFAGDGIHPSSAGYKVWYQRMWKVLYLNNYKLRDEPKIESNEISATE